jgi:lipid-binding SYLF domain-containing protein
MNKSFTGLACLCLLLSLTGCQIFNPFGSNSADKQVTIDQDVDIALQKLYASTPKARALAKNAKGILMFPGVVRAGFIGGGKYGEGALRVNGSTRGYYNIAGLSYGLQAGVQSYDYAMFFMTQNALDYLKESQGWELGFGPSIVVVDKGVANSLTTTTAKSDVYAFINSQKGLMAGLGLNGIKITPLKP